MDMILENQKNMIEKFWESLLSWWRFPVWPADVPQALPCGYHNKKWGGSGLGTSCTNIGWQILTHTSAWNWELNCYISSHNNTRQEKTKHQKILKMLKPLSQIVPNCPKLSQIVPILDCPQFRGIGILFHFFCCHTSKNGSEKSGLGAMCLLPGLESVDVGNAVKAICHRV